MALYECTFIMRQDIPAQDAHKVSDSFVQLIEGLGGKLIKKEYWGLRSLAYEVKKNKKGHYIMLAIDAPSTTVKELERQFKISEDVLKYLTIKVEKIDISPSPMMNTPADLENAI